MKKVKPVVARNARELAAVLGLTPVDGLEIEIRSDLNDKIIEVVRKRGLTHDQVARLAHTSRTRVTAILNRNTQDIPPLFFHNPCRLGATDAYQCRLFRRRSIELTRVRNYCF